MKSIFFTILALGAFTSVSAGACTKKQVDAAKKDIYARAGKLNEQSEAIKDKGYDGPLSNQDLQDLKAINQKLSALYLEENDLILCYISKMNGGSCLPSETVAKWCR